MTGISMEPIDSGVVVVTGANSGIGRATAIHLATKGYTVYGTVRSAAKATKLNAMAADAGAEVKLVELDVADDGSVAAGFAEILDEAGRVDVMVNNAGVGANGVVEECTATDYLDAMNVNLCGAVRCLRAVLPGMRERRNGAIVNITSVAGRIAAIAQQPYVASKWAFEGMSEGLAQELAPFGIRVAIVEPGVTKSAIFAKTVDTPNATGAYDAPYRRMLAMYATGLAQATDPFEVADVVHRAITSAQPQLRHVVSWGAQELIDGRDLMSDEDWLALGAAETDEDYRTLFAKTFGITLTGG